MAEFLQPAGFPKGVSTPTLTALDKANFNGGYEVRSVLTTNIPLSTGQQAGTQDIPVVVASSGSVSGIFIVRFNVNGYVASAVISASMRLSDNKLGSNSVINVLSAQSVDTTLINLKGAYMAWGNNEVALVLNFFSNAGASLNAIVDVFAVDGNTTTLNPKPFNLSTYPNVNQQYSYVDARDNFGVIPLRNQVVGSQVNLDSQLTPGLIICNPASTKPSGTTGIGSCLILSSSDSTVIAQIFTMSDGFLYTRTSINAGVTWTAWTQIMNATSKTQILQSASDAALVWAIIMG